MKINTLRFGTVEIDKSEIITVPEGFIWFPDIKRYVILAMGNIIIYKTIWRIYEKSWTA